MVEHARDGADSSARILDGTATAATIKAELTERVAALATRGIVPGLATVLVGDDPGSRWYVGGKHKDCAEVGIASIRRDLPDAQAAAATRDRPCRARPAESSSSSSATGCRGRARTSSSSVAA